MTETRTTTVQMDEQGRLYIPKPVRRTLGVAETKATVELDVRVVDTADVSGDVVDGGDA